MASTDARPVPQKNVAYRVTFPILNNTGALVTGAAGLDSEVSKDGGTFADCTSEATEIATASGVYFLDLTATEMNADTVAIIVKTTTTDAKTTVLVMYPEEAGDIRVNVTAYGGTAGTFSSGRPEVNTSHAAGTAWNSGAIGAATLAADTIAAAKIATGAITAAKFAAGAIDAAAIADNAIDAGALAADAITAAKVASDVGAEFAAALLDLAAGVETNRTVRQALRIMLAALAGKASGMATTTAVFRDTNDTKDRITATVDSSGNRSAVTLDGS